MDHSQNRELFDIFKRHKEDFFILLHGGVFTYSGGQAIISKNLDGKITDIEIKVKSFKRSKKDTFEF